jgi:hypothetical protein
MDKYEDYKLLQDTLARIMELKALRDQATDPAERRRLQRQIREVQYLQLWQIYQIENRQE